jgi:xanthine/CO dehydrogenase XdhC/CoxF family maturation factor
MPAWLVSSAAPEAGAMPFYGFSREDVHLVLVMAAAKAGPGGKVEDHLVAAARELAALREMLPDEHVRYTDADGYSLVLTPNGTANLFVPK